MIHLFLEDAPRQLTAMQDALQRGDASVLERAAHSLKGAASNLSAHVTVAAALELEKSARNGDMESSKLSLVKLHAAVQQLLPALAELCQGVSK
jgi:HPt (histidine-containing phosphotransfer) domain-containing protein